MKILEGRDSLFETAKPLMMADVEENEVDKTN